MADRLESVEEILEWRPFAAFVRRAKVPGIGRRAARHELTATEETTQLQVKWYGPRAATDLAIAQRTYLDRLPHILMPNNAQR